MFFLYVSIFGFSNFSFSLSLSNSPSLSILYKTQFHCDLLDNNQYGYYLSWLLLLLIHPHPSAYPS